MPKTKKVTGPFHVGRNGAHVIGIWRKGRQQPICVFGQGEEPENFSGAAKYAAKICDALNIMHNASR